MGVEELWQDMHKEEPMSCETSSFHRSKDDPKEPTLDSWRDMTTKEKTTEGRKNDTGKLRYDLFPPQSLAQVAKVFTIGANKYDDRNWEKGIKWGRVFGAMMRHAWAWWNGEMLDKEDGQHHLASVAWCALVLMEFERTHPELDDRSKQ